MHLAACCKMSECARFPLSKLRKTPPPLHEVMSGVRLPLCLAKSCAKTRLCGGFARAFGNGSRNIYRILSGSVGGVAGDTPNRRQRHPKSKATLARAVD